VRSAPTTPLVPTGVDLAGATARPPNEPVGEARSSQGPRPPSIVPQRPPAPEVNFAGPSASDAGTASEGGQDATPCPLCGQKNPRSLRFCVTCGHLLVPLSLPPPSLNATAGTSAPSGRATVTSPPPDPTTTAPVPQTIRPPAIDAVPASPSSQAPIAPGRVVDLGAPALDAMLRLCPRCRGGSDPTSHFCRFCGASLADAPAISLAPRTPPPPSDGLTHTNANAPRSPIPARPSPTPVRSTVAMVSPVSGPAPRARLVLIARDGGEGPGYPLGEAVDIGRLEGNILIGDDRYVSPRHARIQMRGGAYYLRDLGSTNGVFVRIPFARESGGGMGGVPRQGHGRADKSLDQGGKGDGPSATSTKAATALEQAIVDQDLFLAGQQVLKFEVVKHAEEGFGGASDNGTLLFGTPAAPRYARLSQRTVEGVVRDVYHLQKAETIIGREVGDLVFTEDPFLSRRHAAVVIQGSVAPGSKGTRRFSLVDLGSSNGTFLQLREEIRLKNGDHLRIGQQLFRFDLDRPDA
jgi:pSer/pThr/pTyr-binding forkhead associated (FHA) protein